MDVVAPGGEGKASGAAGSTVPLAEQIPTSPAASTTRKAFGPQIMGSHLAIGVIPCRKPGIAPGAVFTQPQALRKDLRP
jgi:hypothetical protein